MAITFQIGQKLAKNVKTFQLSGSLLTLGRQDALISMETCLQILLQQGFATAVDQNNISLMHGDLISSLTDNQTFTINSPINDKFFFGSLGLDVKSLDITHYDGATYAYDLNSHKSQLPKELISKFDVIFEAGTLEHIFNIPNALANIFAMLKPNGVMIHCSPTNNHVDHGLYQFSPTLFYDYYSANKFEILQAEFLRYSPDYHSTEPWLSCEYVPGCLSAISTGGLDNKMYGTWFVVRKTLNSTYSPKLQQGIYANLVGK